MFRLLVLVYRPRQQKADQTAEGQHDNSVDRKHCAESLQVPNSLTLAIGRNFLPPGLSLVRNGRDLKVQTIPLVGMAEMGPMRLSGVFGWVWCSNREVSGRVRHGGTLPNVRSRIQLLKQMPFRPGLGHKPWKSMCTAA